MARIDDAVIRGSASQGSTGQAVSVLSYATPDPSRTGRAGRIASGILLLTSMLTCAVAWVLIVWRVRTITRTGPVIAALGLSLAIVAGCSRQKGAMAIGVGHCLISALSFGLVITLPWGPRHEAFTAIGACYVAFCLPATFAALSRTGTRSMP